MSAHAAFHAAMPALLAHAGRWVGTYTHLNLDGSVHDRHAAEVTCLFPEDGPHAYMQRNRFTWPDGREVTAELPGIFRDGMLWWDVPTFHGKAWQTGSGLIMLELFRKDLPGAWFWEVICPSADGRHRVRTWHWYDAQDRPFRRTLCDEHRPD